jgi:hypothetical protein
MRGCRHLTLYCGEPERHGENRGVAADSPLKRARKQGIGLVDGSIIAFPYMPCVAELPPGWRHWSPAEKVEHRLSMSLDDAY